MDALTNPTRSKKLSISRWVMTLLYAAAGINHFLYADIYLLIIPEYLPFPHAINYVSGLAEIFFALLLIPAATRKWAAYGIIAMLIAFIPAHIYFIELNPCTGQPCLLYWIGWIRLLLIHPLLIYWAWTNRN